MKILHSGNLDMKSGGPALSTYLTIKGLMSDNVTVDCIMPPLSDNGVLVGTDVNIHYTDKVLNHRFLYIPHLQNLLKSLGEYDMYHIQGIWQYAGHIVAGYARKRNRPYVITLRGMMYPEAMNHSSLIKTLSLYIYQRKDLEMASCIQATCIEEMNYYRQLGFTNPVAVLPNPIDIKGIIERPIPKKDKKCIGYLGRVHPRKRIERLIYTFANHREIFKDWNLVVIGSDDREYEHFLRQEVERLKLDNVSFTGFLTGEEKDNAIMNLSFLAVPSDFENFGNIVTEALVRGVPVIATRGMPWQELETNQCGWWINNDQDSIDRTLIEAVTKSDEERVSMGMRGKQLMKDKYSVDVLGKKMALLYRWILKEGEKPDFVYE